MKYIKFEQDNCAPCKMVSNYLDAHGIFYEAINASKSPEQAAKFSIMSVPVTILLDEDGNEVMRVIGYDSSKLQEMIDLKNPQ